MQGNILYQIFKHMLLATTWSVDQAEGACRKQRRCPDEKRPRWPWKNERQKIEMLRIKTATFWTRKKKTLGVKIRRTKTRALYFFERKVHSAFKKAITSLQTGDTNNWRSQQTTKNRIYSLTKETTVTRALNRTQHPTEPKGTRHHRKTIYQN